MRTEHANEQRGRQKEKPNQIPIWTKKIKNKKEKKKATDRVNGFEEIPNLQNQISQMLKPNIFNIFF